MAALEGIPFDIDAVNTLEELRQDLIRAHYAIAVNDQDHKIELFEVIDGVHRRKSCAVNTQM